MDIDLEACRCCANIYVGNECCNIFDNEIEQSDGLLDFVIKILDLWNLKIEIQDGLPQKLCHNCLNKFGSFNEFRKEIVAAQKRLFDINANLQTSLTCSSETALYSHCFDESLGVVSDYGMDRQRQTMLLSSSAVSGALTSVPNENITSDEDGFNKMFGTTNINEISQDLEKVLQGSIITKGNGSNQNIMNMEGSEEMNTAVASTNVSISTETCIEFDANDLIEKDAAIEENNAQSQQLTDVEDPNNRVAGNPTTACQYCFCRTNGPIDHLIFANSEELSQHFFDVHDPNLPYTCPSCSETYKTAKLRDHHVSVAHNPDGNSGKCEYCERTVRNIEQHQCQFIGNWQCEICLKEFHCALYKFRNHQRMHDSSKQLICKFCNKVFLRRANLEAHERQHDNEPHTCDQCKGSFSTEYELKRHKYQAHSGELPIKCEKCNKGFVSLAFLQRHIQHIHPETLLNSDSNELPKCRNCNTFFSSAQKLKFHLRQPRDENGKCTNTPSQTDSIRSYIFSCLHCPRKFQSKYQQEKHIQTHVSRLRPFICDQCNQRFKSALDMKQHKQLVHNNDNIMQYQCDVCHKKFAFRRDLLDHMSCHKEMNFICHESNCSFMCNSQKSLADHIRAKHTAIACEFCGEKYTPIALNTHLRNKHRTEIGVDSISATVATPTSAKLYSLPVDKVRVELNSTEPSLALHEQPFHTFKPLGELIQDDLHYDFSSFEPDHEIEVT